MSGEHKYKDEQNVQIQEIVQKSMEGFEEKFVEGTFMTLESFQDTRHLSHLNREQLVHHIENVLSIPIVSDDQALIGVDIYDHNPGQYRFKRGAVVRVNRTKKEEYDDKRVADKRAEDMLARHVSDDWHRRASGVSTASSSGGAPPPRRAAALDGEGDHHDDELATSNYSAVMSCAGSEVPRRLIGKTSQFGEAFGRGLSQVTGTTCTPNTSLSVRSSVKGSAVSECNRSAAGSPSELVVAGQAGDKGSKKRRKCCSDIVRETAAAVLERVESEMDFAGHWQSATRSREFDALIARLETHGRKSGSIFGDDEATNVSKKLFDMAQSLQIRQRLFESIGTDFVGFARQALSAAYQKILQDAPLDLLGNIINLSCQGVLEKLVGSKEKIAAFVSAVRYVPESRIQPDVISFSMLGRKYYDFAELSKKALTVALCGKILRCTDLAALLASIEAIVEVTHMVDLRNVVFDGEGRL